MARWNLEEEKWQPTPLGVATLASGLPPEHALLVQEDLAKAREGFCMATDLHLTYLVTPVHEELGVDWEVLDGLLQRLSPLNKRVAGFVGLQEGVVMAHKLGRLRAGSNSEATRIAKR